MPPVRSSRLRYPRDWAEIEDELEEFEERMREAEAAPHEGRKRHEMTWDIARINHERSRFIYDAFYRQKKIARATYDFCLREKFADAMLIAKWKKAGFEKLCCLKCMTKSDHSFGTACICRVPKADLDEERAKTIECNHCGCRGCASGD
jgi:bud site selection protein 31